MTAMVKIRILMDNHAEEPLTAQWGLAVWIEYRGRKILLDAGSNGDFVQNAEKMGIDLNEAEFAVLSHAHYDHGDGMEAFFEQNSRAKFYIRRGAGENYYDLKGDEPKYIGLKKGTLERFRDRIVYADGDEELFPGAWLIPHKTAGLEEKGRKACMFCWKDGGWTPDTFAHEQSLVLETEKGLVIFNSCCHAGADCIIDEVRETWPGKGVYALIGGFHLYRSSDREVENLAENIRRTGIRKICTGHCTGDRGMEILKEKLGDQAMQLYAGMTLEL